MAHYYAETRKSTFELIDSETGRHLPITFFAGRDDSGYLTINGGLARIPDYAKISYHPRDNELRYAFTSEVWGRFKLPNSRRKLFLAKPETDTEILAQIYIHRSALFRTDPIKEDVIRGDFPSEKALQLVLTLEQSRLALEVKSIAKEAGVEVAISDAREKIYGGTLGIQKPITGCTQAVMSGEALPLKLVVFGI